MHATMLGTLHMTRCEASARCYTISVNTAVLVTLFQVYDVDDDHNAGYPDEMNMITGLSDSLFSICVDQRSRFVRFARLIE
jgi:hypothetical protein